MTVQVGEMNVRDRVSWFLLRCIGGQRNQHYIADENIRTRLYHFATTRVKILPPRPSVAVTMQLRCEAIAAELQLETPSFRTNSRKKRTERTDSSLGSSGTLSGSTATDSASSVEAGNLSPFLTPAYQKWSQTLKCQSFLVSCKI